MKKEPSYLKRKGGIKSNIIHTSVDNSLNRNSDPQNANKMMRIAFQHTARVPLHQQCYDGQLEASNPATWANC